MRTDLKTWCCLNNGQGYIKVYFEKNAYVQNEMSNICCEIDNSKS